ncbi:MAG: isoaspartyl peptidase/L-asparaginase [Planctomycetota bacterium]|nr:isoaspartyl peptidase/L-asparaginase [Planctomycetota bacterium]
MRLLLLHSLLLVGCAASPQPKVVLAIHGGAGTILRENLTAEAEAAYRAALEHSLRAGHAVLEAGGSAMDAVEAAILPMEDSPLFNAGHGAVLTHEGHCELDASVMDGASGGAGAVAGVRTVRHPIRAARAVMERSPHVLLSGAGADTFAGEQGLEQVDNAYFETERRRRQLERAIAAQARGEDLGTLKFGTVGCVALDQAGHLAAGTSTGGMTNKRWGRIGDSPIIAAGTWADDDTCAVSGTGWGEFFIRAAVAHDIHARMAYGGLTLAEACDQVILEDLTAAGGSGGVIALDHAGRVAAPFNTPGMYRGWIDAEGRVEVHIYGDE